MTERKTNAVLYTILTLAILSYLYFNFFGAQRISVVFESNSILDGESLSNCGGVERTMDGSIDAMGTDVVNIESDDSIKAQTEKEEASSVYIEEVIEKKEHKISHTGYHIFVDLDNLLMYVYKDGEPVKTYECSGGKPNSPSPLGTWKIISKDTWGEGFGGAWLGFNVPWGKYGIHGTSEPWTIGRTNASKGCIRMRNDDVRELYKIVPHNTLVTIVYDNVPFYPMRDGDVGADVKAMERALKKLGYYHGSEDGVFGASLKKAVMKFQKENKLYSTGVINNSTYERIIQLEEEYDEKQKQLLQEQVEERKQLEQELE